MRHDAVCLALLESVVTRAWAAVTFNLWANVDAWKASAPSAPLELPQGMYFLRARVGERQARRQAGRYLHLWVMRKKRNSSGHPQHCRTKASAVTVTTIDHT